MFKVVLIIFFCCTLLSGHDVSKRSFYLLFPRNSVFQFTYGLTVPFVLPRRSINLTWGFQSQYNYPYNISNFFPTTVAVRSGMSFDMPKIRFYQYLVSLLNNFGLDGKQCLLRSVCEVAEIPMYEEKRENVLERIVQFLFTPSIDLEDSARNETLSKKLLQAEKLGKSEGDCDSKYSKCSMSIVELMTALYVS